MKNQSSRPLGVKVIAAVLFLEAAVLLLSAIAPLCLSISQVEHIEALFSTIPYFNRLPLANDKPSIIFATLWGAWAALKGLGIWFMWSWVRILILLDLAGRFGDFILAAATMDHKQQSELLHNPDFVVGFIVNLLVLLYMSDSGVEREFESR